MSSLITYAVCGFGGRGCDSYSIYQLSHPDRFRLTAVADPDEKRLSVAKKTYHVPTEFCFHSGEELLAQPKLADVLIIATQDRDHIRYALPALQKGYHLLLEKPISTDIDECIALKEAARRYERTVMVCHVLRYAPFYETVHQLIADGKIGKLQTIQASENVGYWHFAHSYVRGNWRNAAQSSPVILAKSCHDMDILRWLAGAPCKSVSSFGSLGWFHAGNAPAGSSERCLDCACKDACPYDAEKIYLTSTRTGLLHGNTGWPCSVLVGPNPTKESVLEAIRTGPYGRCVYHCDNDVADHQVVNLDFENGVTASFTLSAFSQECHRTLLVTGSHGEIFGDMEENKVTLHRFGEAETVFELDVLPSEYAGHGGGDQRMMDELYRVLTQGDADVRTGIDVSVESHAIAMAAEKSRTQGGRTVDLPQFMHEATKKGEDFHA